MFLLFFLYSYIQLIPMSSNDDDEDRGTLSYLEPVSVESVGSSQRTGGLDLNKSYLDEVGLKENSYWINR